MMSPQVKHSQTSTPEIFFSCENLLSVDDKGMFQSLLWQTLAPGTFLTSGFQNLLDLSTAWTGSAAALSLLGLKRE